MYQARLVACRYSKVPGIDFSETYSLVVNDVTFRIMLLMVLHFGYLAKIVDVKQPSCMVTLKKKSIWSIHKE